MTDSYLVSLSFSFPFNPSSAPGDIYNRCQPHRNRCSAGKVLTVQAPTQPDSHLWWPREKENAAVQPLLEWLAWLSQLNLSLDSRAWASGQPLKAPSQCLASAASCSCCTSAFSPSDFVWRNSKISSGWPRPPTIAYGPGLTSTCPRGPPSLQVCHSWPLPAILSNDPYISEKIACIWHGTKWLTPVSPFGTQPGTSVRWPSHLRGLGQVNKPSGSRFLLL